MSAAPAVAPGPDPAPAAGAARGGTRDARADLLKAAAVYGVVYIHAAGGAGDLTAVFRFCVPVFVAVWARYFAAGLARRPAGERMGYARTRLARLVAPYAAWTALYVWLFGYADRWRETPPHTILGGWLGGYGWPGQYFLIVLFQLVPVVVLLHRWAGRRALVGLVAAGALVGPVSGWALWGLPYVAQVGDRAFVYWLPYAALGVLVARDGPRPRSSALLVLAGVGLLALAPVESRWAADRGAGGSPYLLFTVALGSIGLILAASGRPGRPASNPVTEWVSLAAGWVGRNTYPVYLSNPLLLALLPREVWDWAGQDPAALGAVAAGVTATGAVLGTAVRRAGLGVLIGD